MYDLRHALDWQNAILWVPWAIIATEAAVLLGAVLLARRWLRQQ